MSRPRYFAAAHSHCFFVDNAHIYFYRRQPCQRGLQTGISTKRRRRDQQWRHVSLRVMRYESAERGHGWVRHYELCWHLSSNWRGNRIIGSKRYFRFKVCL